MSCGTMRAGRAVEATNSGSLREPNSNARRGRQKDSGARLFARRKSPSRSTATPREPSRRRPAQRTRKPLRFRAVRDLSRPTPTRTALKPESREGRRNQRLRQFGRPEKRQSRTLRQANRLRHHWNRNPVVALKRLPRNGRSGKSRRPAILEYGPSLLSMGPVSDSQRAPLSNLDPSQKGATLRPDGGRPFAGFTRLVFAGSPNVCALQTRIDAEVAVTMARATGAKQNGLRDHSWEKRPSPRGRFRVLTAPRRSSCQRRDSRD